MYPTLIFFLASYSGNPESSFENSTLLDDDICLEGHIPVV